MVVIDLVPQGEAVMSLARVVAFEGVTAERVARLREEIGHGDVPEGIPATEILVLHDPATERSLVVLFFADEAAYATGDAFLDAMPADETPGRRASVGRYEVAVRRSM